MINGVALRDRGGTGIPLHPTSDSPAAATALMVASGRVTRDLSTPSTHLLGARG